VFAAATLLLALTIPLANADQYVQYGADNRNGSGWATGIGSTIQVDQAFSYDYQFTTDRYYWAGIYFADGIFIQLGFKDFGSLTACQGLSFFVQEFDARGNKLEDIAQDCVPAGAARYFNLVNSLVPSGDGRFFWQPRVGTTNIGPSVPLAHSFPFREAFAVSEVSTNGLFVANPNISNVRYDPAVRLVFLDGTWHDQAEGRVYRPNDSLRTAPCPPYRAGSGTFNTLVTSNSGTITCKADGVALW